MIHLTEDLMVGHSIIDGDHQRLIEIINEFIEKSTVHVIFEGSTQGEYAKVMNVALKSLIAYTQDHFAREEKIQKESGYPHFEMHSHEHRVLVVQLKNIARKYFVSKSKPLGKDALIELQKFMNFWLTDHIRKFDCGMREWVSSAES